jgi:DNA polymerase
MAEGQIDAHAELLALNAEVATCPLCDLQHSRVKAVPGDGPLDAEIMFIGEAPGYHENMQGRPFVGPSGHFLDELLASIGLKREQVFITNVVKCRPPNNRDPFPQEIEACAPYLTRQIALIKPKMVVTLGRFSMAKFFPGQSISKIHGKPRREGNVIYYPMYHPAAALHRQDLMDTVREDMLKIPALIEEARAAVAAGEQAPGDDEAPQQLSLF